MKLRPMNEQDLDNVLAWRNHPDIRKNMYNTNIISVEEHKKWFASLANNVTRQYFIYEHQDKPFGVVAFTDINARFHNSSWAFYADPAAPLGTGMKMEYLALEYAFNNLNLHKLYCEVISFNDSVIKLHQRFGFETEGVFKEQVFMSGAFYDVHRLGLFAAAWHELRDSFSKIVHRRG